MAAQKSLSIKLLKIGGRCAVTLTLYDLETETAERSASTRASCDEAGVLEVTDALIGQLAL